MTVAPTAAGLLRDTLGRPLRNLRLSVTDRCNLRCSYCMPEPDYVWLPRSELLTFEEMTRVVGVFCSLGVDRVRLTGGEPLLRHQLPELVRRLAAEPRLRDIALTTNGVLLAELARPLREAGLGRVTVSLDTLRPERFRALTRRDEHARVLAGIAAVRAAGFPGPKLDAVVMRGRNDDELVSLLDYAREQGAELRFIEYMDVGGATRWRREDVVPRAEMLEQLTRAHGPIEPVPEEGPPGERGRAPAERFRLPDGTVFGIIASTTSPFCRSCDRSRLTADGTWFLCLYARAGLNLRRALRAGASDAELAAMLRIGWQHRVDRGAEQRLALRDRQPLVDVAELREDPRLEMHTRGG
ncbi:MAG TPA: GTP 3',8-cyclase MoaA [Myxococcaceae bacterium]|nr:GTP 3',8-cyclase MoaA [Myxococcaceae bacterium]